MRVDAFDFDLPEALIALRPAVPRRAARLLHVGADGPSDHKVTDLPGLLRPGDMLVFNDTKVIPARLFGHRTREGGAPVAIEVTLAERREGAHWIALARPGKRLRPGDVIDFGGVSAEVVARGDAGFVTLRFDRDGPALDTAIAETGVMPLPPYIAARRPADRRDDADYQTIFADRPGAVAAPTAALHFDDVLLRALEARGILSTRVTLHVGAGTFLPVKAEDTAEHRMHAETGEITEVAAAAIRSARAAGGRVIAVGTTALRVLETAARGGDLRAWSGATDIFITPGYRFAAIDGLITNFHLPRSTLFMLVSALVGLPEMKAAYAHAIRHEYRFYSYGDASLIWGASGA